MKISTFTAFLMFIIGCGEAPLESIEETLAAEEVEHFLVGDPWVATGTNRYGNWTNTKTYEDSGRFIHLLRYDARSPIESIGDAGQEFQEAGNWRLKEVNKAIKVVHLMDDGHVFFLTVLYIDDDYLELGSLQYVRESKWQR